MPRPTLLTGSLAVLLVGVLVVALAVLLDSGDPPQASSGQPVRPLDPTAAALPPARLEPPVTVDPAPALIRQARTGQGEFVLATYNVLGHSHTTERGDKPRFAGSAQRMRWTLEVLERNGVDVVGLQEFQVPQRRALLAQAGDRFGVFSPPDAPADSIAWRKERFRLVWSRTLDIPYFFGDRPMPVVMLRDRLTGQRRVFISVHNPASTRRNPGNAPKRREALRRELALVERLHGRLGVPVILMGDFNARDQAFCPATASGLLHSSRGGSHEDGVCLPPPDSRIDWIFGTPEVEFDAHVVARGGLVGRSTDHPVHLTIVR